MMQNKLEQRQAKGNLRSLKQFSHLIDFSSNDYLGLSRSSKLLELFQEELKEFSALGSTGSRLITGNGAYIETLEAKIADFHEVEAALLFTCGYMANVGLLSSLKQDEATIIADAHVHASIHDGIKLSGLPSYSFRHNDLKHLELRLQKCPAKERYVVIESLYSTDGSLAPLKEIFALTERYKAHLIVDEAHAVGVLGPQGRGLVAEAGLENSLFAQIVTFGKALGAGGAAILGSSLLRKYLINFARSFIYTTALSFPSLALIKASYTLFPKMEEERKKLQKLLGFFEGGTHIQAIKIPGNEVILKKAEELQKNGFDVRALLSPTVQRGQEILRVCLHAFNTEEEVKALLKAL